MVKKYSRVLAFKFTKATESVDFEFWLSKNVKPTQLEGSILLSQAFIKL